MQFTHNTLPLPIRQQSVESLNLHLAASIDLQGQVKQAHWNVRGPGFIAVHELFDRVAEEIEGFSDLLAERIGGLGGTAFGTIQVAASRSFLIPYPHDIDSTERHLFAVASSLAAFGQSARAAIDTVGASGDADSADLFTEISRGVDQQIWLVESNLAPKSNIN
jgi:starvation-inducible DNA-binding protein